MHVLYDVCHLWTRRLISSNAIFKWIQVVVLHTIDQMSMHENKMHSYRTIYIYIYMLKFVLNIINTSLQLSYSIMSNKCKMSHINYVMSKISQKTNWQCDCKKRKYKQQYIKHKKVTTAQLKPLLKRWIVQMCLKEVSRSWYFLNLIVTSYSYHNAVKVKTLWIMKDI